MLNNFLLTIRVGLTRNQYQLRTVEMQMSCQLKAQMYLKLSHV